MRDFARFVFDFEMSIGRPIKLMQTTDSNTLEMPVGDILVNHIVSLRGALDAALRASTVLKWSGCSELTGPQLYDQAGDYAPVTLRRLPYRPSGI